MMATGARLTPTVFDKLVADVEISGLRSNEVPEVMSEVMRYYPVAEINRFGEAALRATVKRDLAWLLNTTQFGARGELEGYSEVQTSVLNYGVPDLAGRSLHTRTVLDRAREIRTAIRVFETRLDAESLIVEPLASEDKPNTVIFLIHAEISSGVRPVPVEYRTELEADTAAVEVSG
jgi:type VI secretion system protein ImpF